MVEIPTPNAEQVELQAALRAYRTAKRAHTRLHRLCADLPRLERELAECRERVLAALDAQVEPD